MVATDEELLTAAHAGDRAALEALLERYQPRIYRFGMKMCGEPECAKDVLQETLLALARNVGGFRGESALSTWLFAVARSHFLKQRGRGTHRPKAEGAPLDEVAHVPDPGPDPEARAAGGELSALVDAALRRL